MKRKISRITPFTLSSDFTAPEADKPDTLRPDEIRLGQVELATLLQQARTETADLIRNDILAQEADKLARISARFETALSQIIDLANHLESAHLAECDRIQALASVRKLASNLLDGQGDFFDKN